MPNLKRSLRNSSQQEKANSSERTMIVQQQVGPDVSLHPITSFPYY